VVTASGGFPAGWSTVDTTSITLYTWTVIA